ncbi:hypothetical protein CCACVL1_30988, partial [Corchorus capsularis]
MESQQPRPKKDPLRPKCQRA